MNYIDFVNNLADDLQEEFEKRNKSITVDVVKMNKPWGKEIGIKVSDGRRIDPVRYPKEQYEYHEAGGDYSSMLERFADSFERDLAAAPVHFNFDLNKLKENIIMQLVNTKCSHMYLKDKPHREFEDLSVIYKLNVDVNENDTGSIAITLDMMEELGFDEETLYQLAMEKAPVNLPCEIKNMAEILGEMMPGFDNDEMDSPLYVVTNASRCLGASSILYPGVLENCADIMNGNFFVLPSSTHEVLICPADDAYCLSELKAIVKEVNDTQVSPEDLLSYSVYHYDWKEKVFELAEKYEARMQAKEKQSIMGNLEIKRRELSRNGQIRRNQDIGSRKIQGGSLCL